MEATLRVNPTIAHGRGNENWFPITNMRWCPRERVISSLIIRWKGRLKLLLFALILIPGRGTSGLAFHSRISELEIVNDLSRPLSFSSPIGYYEEARHYHSLLQPLT